MKKNNRNNSQTDLRGFEEFIEAQGEENFSSKINQKKEAPVENITFLLNETERLKKQKKLLNDQMRVIEKFDQSQELINELRMEIEIYRNKILEISIKEDSPFHNSMRDIFDPFFKEGSN